MRLKLFYLLFISLFALVNCSQKKDNGSGGPVETVTKYDTLIQALRKPLSKLILQKKVIVIDPAMARRVLFFGMIHPFGKMEQNMDFFLEMVRTMGSKFRL